MANHPHVIVLGLGIVGSSIAATLADKGFRVTGIEQFSPLHQRGSSHGDTRIFRRVPHEGDAYMKLANASHHGWLAWNKQAKNRLFIPCGGIDAGPQDSPMVRAAEGLCREQEQPFTLMSGGTFNRQYPHFNLPNDWRVVYQSASGIVRPDATRTFLHAMARSRGARLLHDTPVLEVATHADTTRLRTAKEILTCDYLIVAAGSWLLKVLPQLEFPLRPERRVLAWFQPRIQTELCDGRVPIFCLDADGGWYGMPTPEGAIKIGHDKHLSQQIDPDKPSIEPSDEDAEALKPCVQKYLTGFEPQTLAMKSCIYTLSKDHHFLMDRHPQHPQIFIFSCCSGHGFKYAPAYGEVAADMLSGKLQSETFSFLRGGVAASRFA